MSPEKEKLFRDHINKRIRSFKRKIVKLAIDNDFPYITSILEAALQKMERSIAEGTCDCRPGEYGLMGWNIK